MNDFLRQSQVLTTYGPGAMVDLPEHAVLIMGLDSWKHGAGREEIVEPRLQVLLRRKLGLPEVRLVKPPAFDERPQAPKTSIDARIFPTWFLVQEAKPSGPRRMWRQRRLVRSDELRNGRFPDDTAGARTATRRPVVPVRFVCGCPRGHLDDLDWWVFAHRTRGPRCGRRMWLEERGTSGDIGETVVGCECGIQPRPLSEALKHDTRALGTCQGKRPWLGPNTEEDCNLPYRLLVRSASNAYFPLLQSVISLPEEDPGLTARLDPVWHIIGSARSIASLAIFREIPDVAQALAGLTNEEAWALIERRRNADGPQADMPVKEAEFALLDLRQGTRGQNSPDSPFHAEALGRDVWDRERRPELAAVSHVVLVHRLREVVAQVGFTRFEAIGLDEQGEIDVSLDIGVAPAALSAEPRWFPAIENRGEGIFVAFDAAAVDAWLELEAVKGRGRQLQAGAARWQNDHPGAKRHFPEVPYVLLHSLSHALLMQIALDCGYPAASLRERVYALPRTGMYGILIHTGTSDAEGTLGGLVEAGRRIGSHLVAAIESLRLCSNDPVCAEHDPGTAHDPAYLQGAACHGCLLIAETSCEQRNDWLDRALVVPTVADGGGAFFP